MPLKKGTLISKKKIAIVQSNYIPWKGYFDLIRQVDEFVFYDDVQYTKRDWRNRNLIKTSAGLQWLTIPVETKGKFKQLICETKVSDSAWRGHHWKAICLNYTKAPFFKDYENIFQLLYLENTEIYLSKINFEFIRTICDLLQIKTKLSWSMNYSKVEGQTENLLNICLAAGAQEYISGPAAKDYLDEKIFMKAGVHVSWMNYAGYPEYPQLFPPFEHGVSILDLLFNRGAESLKYMSKIPSF